MSDGLSSASEREIDIQPLITKLGHSVKEIRVRALKNIIFKLDHDLLCISDVVHKKDLYVKLLEWFNFEICPQQKDVLQLLGKLSKHSSGLETLVSISAVEFLSQFRHDADPMLYQCIDDVLSNLLSLPDVVDIDNEQQLHYGREMPGDNIEVNVKCSDTNHVKIHHSKEECSIPVPKSVEGIQVSPTGPKWHAEEDTKSLRDWYFPWISLADSDLHVLATTNTRLQSSNTDLAKKSCEFLNYVLFKDFPAEIFLQRPSIVMTLLTLLELRSEERQCLSMAAMTCLSTLCAYLKHRYLLMTDPQWYSLYPDCWKQWLQDTSEASSNAASPTSELSDLRTTGDGGKQSSSESFQPVSSRGAYGDQAGGLVREALQLNQKSIEEFCLQVLRGCCPLLLTAGNPLRVLLALREALSLLQACYPHYQWLNRHKLKPLREEICGLAAKAIDHHMVRCGLRSSDAIVEHNITRHATTVVNIALWLMEFFGPQISVGGNLDEDVSNVFQALLTNEIIFATFPQIRTSLDHSPILINDADFLEVYRKALTVKDSFIASVEFLRDIRGKGQTTQDSLIQKLDSCLLGLPYNRHRELIDHAINLISNIQRTPSTRLETKSKCKNILLSMLSSLDIVVKRMSYESCCDVLRKALKHSHVTNPMSNHCNKALFMIDQDVLHVLSAFGMADEDEKVAKTASCIVETLLHSRLNMTTQMWRKLLDDLVTSLPFLQMYLDKRSSLGVCLLGLLSPPGDSPCSLTADGEIVPFSQFERLRGWLRSMFLRDKTLRAKNYGYLIHRLVEQDAKLNCRMVYPSGSLQNSCELFIFDTFAASVRLHRSTRHANFDQDRIRKLFDIVTADTSELSLRKSSAEQLSVLMQDPTWHNVLHEENADTSLIKLLHECLYKDGKAHISSAVNPKLDLVSPCLKIVRLLAEYGVGCRHKLAQDASVYDILSRHALLAPAGGTVRYEVSCVMTLLLFDEVARCPLPEERRENGGDIMFALPALVLKRYYLPFNPPIYDMFNPYQREKFTESDPLRSEPVLSMLRVAWNLAWRESPDDVPQVTSESSDSMDNELPWTHMDSQLLKSCAVKTAVAEVIQSLMKATSHYAAKQAVNRLSLLLLATNNVKEYRSKTDLTRQVFYCCDWKTAFERYFTMFPKSSEDDQLLNDILKMFKSVITNSYPTPPEDFLGWLAHLIMTPDSAMTSLLHVREEHGNSAQTESKRMLRKDLLEFLVTFTRSLRGVRKPWLWSGELVYAGDFTLSLTHNLNLTDSPQYYDLPVLETTLECLVEITAIAGFSAASKLVEPKQLCVDILTSLLQVLTAFNAGRLGAMTSFMGRGVTMSVSLCLTHLVHEVLCVLNVKDWPTLFPAITDDGNSTDFPWLSAMWSDHLAEVRWCGLAVATHILQQNRSPPSIRQNFPGGLWNLAVIILMDAKECCLVRDQAATLFSTLLACLKKNEDNPKYETGLLVQTENETVSGVPALHLLLSHHKFFACFHEMLSNLVIRNTPRLPGTTTFTESLSTSSTRSKCAIPYQSIDTESARSSGRSSTETTALTPCSLSGEFGKGLHRESPPILTVSGSIEESSQPSSTTPLLTGSRVMSASTGNDNRSSTPPLSVDCLETLAWVSPRFVASMSGLVTNLVLVSPEKVLDKIKEEDLLGIFISHLDNKHAVSLVSQLETSGALTSKQTNGDATMTSQERHLEMNAIDTLVMYRQICTLLLSCSRQDLHISHALQQNGVVLERILQLFDISCSTLGGCAQKSCHLMWGSVVVLFVSLIKTAKDAQFLETPLEEMLRKYWRAFTAAFEEVMQADTTSTIRTHFLHLLSHLLLREGRRAVSRKGGKHNLTCLLDGDSKPANDTDETNLDGDESKSEEKLEIKANGAELCTILYAQYVNDTQGKQDRCVEERKFAVLALQNLLCISYKAKQNAIEVGFLTKSLEKIKQLHYQLNMESLETSKHAGPRKKEMELLKEIVCVLELLKNLVFRSNEAKLTALEAGVVPALQQLWSWCTVAKTICLAVLELLCTLTARCPKAAIAMSNTSSGFGSSVRLGPSNNTFVHCVVKMAIKYGGKLLNNSTGQGNLACCHILFSLLRNMAMTSECRGILWKSNFIAEFSRLKSLSLQKWKAGEKALIGLWMELLANVAFYRDGQQMIVKIEHFIPLLLEFCASKSKKVHEAAMLLLRNMCFHVPSKTLLLSNREVVELLLTSADKPSAYVRAMGASALWALLTNNQKAKSILAKPALVVKRLSDSQRVLAAKIRESALETREDKHERLYEQAVENILKILR